MAKTGSLAWATSISLCFWEQVNLEQFIWGTDAVFLLPTATDSRFGGEKWGAGPAAVGLTMQGPWVIGALVQNIWSFAGPSDENDVNQMLGQYFINYNLPAGWYLTFSPIITANWKADSDNRWTVPIGGGFGRLFKIGKLPFNTKLRAFYNVEKPDLRVLTGPCASKYNFCCQNYDRSQKHQIRLFR